MSTIDNQLLRTLCVPRDLTLTPVQGRIITAVLARPGIDAETIVEAVWGDDASPRRAAEIIGMHVVAINHLLRPHGLVIRGCRTAYHVQTLGDLSTPAIRAGDSFH